MELTIRQKAIKMFVDDMHSKKRVVTIGVIAKGFNIDNETVRVELRAIRQYKKSYSSFGDLFKDRDLGGLGDFFKRL